MIVHETNVQDWVSLKTVRLEALLDAPTAFGVSYQAAINYTDERWKELASSESQPHFWLALDRDVDKAGISRFGRCGVFSKCSQSLCDQHGISARDSRRISGQSKCVTVL